MTKRIFLQKHKEDIEFSAFFRKSTHEYNSLLQEKDQILESFKNENSIIDLLNGDIISKLLAFRLLNFTSNISNRLAEEYLDSSLGLTKKFRQIDFLFLELTRILGFVNLTKLFLQKIESSSSEVEVYYLLENLSLVNLIDLITVESGKITLDAKATFHWETDHFKKTFSQNQENKFSIYEDELNEVMLNRYELVMTLYKYTQKPPIMEASRVLFPFKDDCPRSLLTLYKELIKD